MAEAKEPESGTRETILQLIIERGPITAANLAKLLYLTPAAVRRHIGVLEEDAAIEVHETMPTTRARRGRPARHYVATLEGQSIMKNQYSTIAADALDFIRQELGPEMIETFANQRVEEFEEKYRAELDKAGDDPTSRAQALAKKLSEEGYAASLRTVGPRGGYALQLCQGHCPVQQVAGQFPNSARRRHKRFHACLAFTSRDWLLLLAGITSARPTYHCSSHPALRGHHRVKTLRKEINDTDTARRRCRRADDSGRDDRFDRKLQVRLA